MKIKNYKRKALGAKMAYTDRNAAYDLSLFEEKQTASSALPKRKEQKVHTEKVRRKTKAGSKLLTLPEREINRIRRRKNNPLKLIASSFVCITISLVIGTIIAGQVRINELTNEIQEAKTVLANSQSVYTQNQMKVEAELSKAEIQEYAENVLGMTKATNTQKEFVTLSGGDKAEVTLQKDTNLFTEFIESVKNLWS